MPKLGTVEEKRHNRILYLQGRIELLDSQAAEAIRRSAQMEDEQRKQIELLGYDPRKAWSA